MARRRAGLTAATGTGPVAEDARPDCTDRTARWGAEVDDYLRSLGATDEQIERAREDAQLIGLGADLVLSRGADRSAADLAAEAGRPLDEVLRFWRTLGVTVPGPERPMFTATDVAFTTMALALPPVHGHGDELFRVLGASLSRVAEAAVALYVQTVEPGFDTPEADPLEWAKDMVATTSAAMKLGEAMGSVFAHHMRDAIDRQRATRASLAERSLANLAIGFVDLVGFTPLARRSSPAELLRLVGAFEERAAEVATAGGGRVVKHIGDEVMFVALSADAGCAIARELVAAAPEGIHPRGGVALGEVITRHGDYYGNVVNLASRLAELAVPAEVLVDAATAGAAHPPHTFRPAGRRQLKGFDDPLEVFSLDLG